MAELDRDPTPQRFAGHMSVGVRLSAGEDITILCGETIIDIAILRCQLTIALDRILRY